MGTNDQQRHKSEHISKKKPCKVLSKLDYNISKNATKQNYKVSPRASRTDLISLENLDQEVLSSHQERYFDKIMSMSVPYHPYKCCLICGSSYAAEISPKKPPPVIEKSKGQEWIVEWWPDEGPLAEKYKNKEVEKKKCKLLRCSGCHQAPYCSQNCQRKDWNVSLNYGVLNNYVEL